MSGAATTTFSIARGLTAGSTVRGLPGVGAHLCAAYLAFCSAWADEARLPGDGRALGLWRAQDAAGMQAIVESLPLDAWLTVETTPLTQHPSDPGIT
jgi:hypothetical protein